MLKSKTFVSDRQFINAWSYFTSVCPNSEIVDANELAIAYPC
jgi:hypothetical protein